MLKEIIPHQDKGIEWWLKLGYKVELVSGED